jgi:hypothetical protein
MLLILMFPFIILVIIVMFIVALICAFFTGIVITTQELFKELGCVAGVILFPAAVIVGGLGATLFPWVYKRYILNIHYMFWL